MDVVVPDFLQNEKGHTRNGSLSIDRDNDTGRGSLPQSEVPSVHTTPRPKDKDNKEKDTKEYPHHRKTASEDVSSNLLTEPNNSNPSTLSPVSMLLPSVNSNPTTTTNKSSSAAAMAAAAVITTAIGDKSQQNQSLITTKTTEEGKVTTTTTTTTTMTNNTLSPSPTEEVGHTPTNGNVQRQTNVTYGPDGEIIEEIVEYEEVEEIVEEEEDTNNVSLSSQLTRCGMSCSHLLCPVSSLT
jgi:hypothetical protein